MLDTDIQSLSIMLGQFLSKKLSLTNQNNRDLPSSGSHNSAINFMSGRVISTHGVNSDYGAFIQKISPLFFYAKDVLTLVTAT
jgi:hypothetical protein